MEQKELERYDKVDLKKADDMDALETATNKGLKQGIEQGIEQGEQNKTLEIAKNSILQGLDSRTISLITNLTIKQIEDLRGTL